MHAPIWVQVLPHVRSCEEYIRASFGLKDGSAADIVQEAWTGLMDKPAIKIKNPKRYLLRACRWRALQVLRGRRHGRRMLAELAYLRKDDAAADAPEILIALEDEDKPKFYEGRVTPGQQEVLDLMIEGKSEVEVSALLRLPASTVRMRVHLARRRLSA